jgi:hypothetical protein
VAVIHAVLYMTNKNKLRRKYERSRVHKKINKNACHITSTYIATIK